MSRILKVLYVEDDSDDAQILKQMLQVMDPTGFNLSVCRTQRQAKAQLLNESYDLVLVDYWLKQTEKGPALDLIDFIVEHSDYLPLMVLSWDTSGVAPRVRELAAKGRIRLASKSDLSLTTLQELVRTLGDKAYSVLIVDDDPDEHVLLKQHLKAITTYRFRIEHAQTEYEALQALEAGPFDIMLIDWRIGGQDAEQVISQCVKKNPHGCIALITACELNEIPRKITDLINPRQLAYLSKSRMDSATFEDTVMAQLFRTHLMPTENLMVTTR